MTPRDQDAERAAITVMSFFIGVTATVPVLMTNSPALLRVLAVVCGLAAAPLAGFCAYRIRKESGR